MAGTERSAPERASSQRKLFLIEWDEALAASRANALRHLGWKVEHESVDGASAYKRIRAAPPDVVVIVASSKPSHGIETARSLREAKATRELPLIFIDADPPAHARISGAIPDARFVSSAELPRVLDTLRPARA